MIAPTLTPSEIDAVRGAAKMLRLEYPYGSVIATDGRHTLFAAGCAESFAFLWAQAEAIREEAAR